MANELSELIERSPKVISPTTHGVIDYMVVAAFFITAGACWEDNKRASIAALANGAAVLGTSMFTDYWGDGRKPISFKTHGKIDVGQMIAAAAAPLMLGFAGEGPAAFFFSQAASEAGVLAMTDFRAADRQARRLEAA
jgi:hypothetical protein